MADVKDDFRRVTKLVDKRDHRIKKKVNTKILGNLPKTNLPRLGLIQDRENLLDQSTKNTVPKLSPKHSEESPSTIITPFPTKTPNRSPQETSTLTPNKTTANESGLPSVQETSEPVPTASKEDIAESDISDLKAELSSRPGITTVIFSMYEERLPNVRLMALQYSEHVDMSEVIVVWCGRKGTSLMIDASPGGAPVSIVHCTGNGPMSRRCVCHIFFYCSTVQCIHIFSNIKFETLTFLITLLPKIRVQLLRMHERL